MDSAIQKAVDAWLNDPAIADADKQEIHQLVEQGDEKSLTDRFYRDLEFGTGGMRGVIGAGRNRMNVYTVGAAAQGLANYIAAQGEAAKKGGLVIAYDCRRQSDVFAQRTASVMAGNGITAYVFEHLRPTPELSFAVRHLGCTAGVVITASHNPPEYNGFKAYWSDGVQVVPPHDKAIIKEVQGITDFGQIKAMEPGEAESKGLIKKIGRDVDEAFIQAADATCLNREVCREQGKSLKVVFTNLHGTGGELIPEVLRRRGFQNVLEVPEQKGGNGEFPTVESPNPEEPPALTLGINLAKQEGADLVVGTDPDADRVGAAVRKPDGDFVCVTGNQMAALLAYYLFDQHKKNGTLPENAVLITTIVSGDLMKDIARAYGGTVIETLTGFKWIGQQIESFVQAEAAGEPTMHYVFGAEESYGYMPATFTRDKDAVTSTAFICELAAVAASQGKNLYGVLTDLYREYGYYQEGAKSLTLKGKEGADKIQAIMDGLRSSPPKSIGDIPVKTVADITTGEIKAVQTGKVLGRYELPSSNVMMFVLEDETKVIVRPSGTEPKIKFYVLTKEADSDLEKARATATDRIKRIAADMTKDA